MCGTGSGLAGALNPRSLLTGLNTTNPIGMIVDPLNISGKFGAKKVAIPDQPDPAATQAQAEASAQSDANQKLAASKRAQRANVLALGGSDDALGGGPLGALPTAQANVLGSGASSIGAGPTNSAGTVLAGGSGGYSGSGGRSRGVPVKGAPL